MNDRPIHPWRATFFAKAAGQRARNNRSHKPQEDFSGPGERLADRAYGARLRHGFTELESSYNDEKGNR